MEFKIPFSGRGHYYTEAEIDAAVTAMCEAVPLTQGNYLRFFENRFREYAQIDYAFALSNATAGLELAAQLCQFKPGDEVIIPAHTFTSSAYPFVKENARIVWADIDVTTRVISPETITPCISSRTRAIVVPHLYGFGADMPGIMELAHLHDLYVIEDAAQALGVMIGDQMAGTFGDVGVYSFHSHKNVTTLGEGGMMTVKNSQWADVIPMLRHNGHCAYSFNQPEYWIPAMGNVDLPELNGENLWPMNCCAGEVVCAVGAKLLDRADQVNLEKRDRALTVIDALADYHQLLFHREDSTRHNYHLLVAQVRSEMRDSFMRRMANHHGIQCVVQYYPLNRYPFYKKLGFSFADCPNTDAFFDNMVSFPFNHLLTDSELDKIVFASRETLDYLQRR
jgi:dTDP-4-amino-4,6-dideoxygalactose transaminase